jgi:23S rRNA pseudouridine1911/1915/1917 synthase
MQPVRTSPPPPPPRRLDPGDGIDVHLDATGKPRVIERRFVVDDASAGQRLDHYLKRQIPRLSRTRLQTIIRSSLERGGGRPLKAHSPVAAGEQLVIRQQARPEPPCPRRFDVLYEDPHVLVVDKPAGLPVHASAKFYFNTLARLVMERYPDQGLQMAHRIDRETSGCLVLARGKHASAFLKTAFEHKRVAKTYLAIVHGDPPWPGPEADGDDAVIDLPLALVEGRPDRVSVRMEVRPGGLEAITRVRVVERHGRCALVRCAPLTGRQHQIRAHLAAAGYPIVGDKLYAHGDEAFAEYCARGLTDELAALFELPRHALHAASIRFPHPATGSAITVESPLPGDLVGYLRG